MCVYMMKKILATCYEEKVKEKYMLAVVVISYAQLGASKAIQIM